MKIGEVKKECNKHGNTVHRLYTRKTDGYINFQCVECTLERRRGRLNDPDKRSRDYEYTLKWMKTLNKKRYNEYRKEYERKRRI